VNGHAHKGREVCKMTTVCSAGKTRTSNCDAQVCDSLPQSLKENTEIVGLH
jgi:hypothetical protein